MFLFVVVSGQTKKAISLRLCGYILEEFFFPEFGALCVFARAVFSGKLVRFELGRGCG